MLCISFDYYCYIIMLCSFCPTKLLLIVFRWYGLFSQIGFLFIFLIRNALLVITTAVAAYDKRFAL